MGWGRKRWGGCGGVWGVVGRVGWGWVGCGGKGWGGVGYGRVGVVVRVWYP